MKFEWDENKNESNKRKHNVSFEEASSVFDDEDSLEQRAVINGERRIIRVGKTATKLILLVVYTLRKAIVRIISARQAGRSERNAYIGNKLDQNVEDDES
jgi:uncharacterized DUF497 family protein